MDVRHPSDGFTFPRACISSTGRDVSEGDVGMHGQPLTLSAAEFVPGRYNSSRISNGTASPIAAVGTRHA